MSDEVILVDATGLKCPLPVLKARKAIKNLKNGEEIRVISTDQASPIDFKHFCNSNGHKLIEINQKEDRFEFLIKKME